MSSPDNIKRIIIIAGPNGAGKTTFAKEFLPNELECIHFVNADLIAAGLSPFKPETAAIHAGKLMLKSIDEHVSKLESFVFETTLSAKGYARKIPHWQSLGYHVDLVFLKLDNVEIAIDRVAQRVTQGGHFIPEEVIRRRFLSGWKNMQDIYKPIVNSWVIYDNSTNMPLLLEWSEQS